MLKPLLFCQLKNHRNWTEKEAAKYVPARTLFKNYKRIHQVETPDLEYIYTNRGSSIEDYMCKPIVFW